ncbi:MAG: sel1 repeat family protein [Victivallales bacterium]|jgi:hypothetical protein|nr:sel1 repeat family protein [Victivallales bacterium]
MYFLAKYPVFRAGLMSVFALLAGCSPLERLKSAAKSGEPQAQYELARYYRTENPAFAFLWMRRAAEQNYPEAMVKIGKYYFDGFGIGRDKNAAFYWWRKAALDNGNLEAAELLEESLLPDPPPGQAKSAIAAGGLLLADPECKERKQIAQRLLNEGIKLRKSLRLSSRYKELLEVEKEFTAIFRRSLEHFDLTNPKVLEAMDHLSDETYRIPPLTGNPPAPTETDALCLEFAALLDACDRLETDDLPELMAVANELPDFQDFLSTVPDLIVPMFFGRPELYGEIKAGRSFYDFALFGTYMKIRRDFDSYSRSFPVLEVSRSVRVGKGKFLFALPGLLPISADKSVKYGKCELFGVQIWPFPEEDFQSIRAKVELKYGVLTPVNHTFELICESRPYIVRITVPAYRRIGGKLKVMLFDRVKPSKVELVDLVPNSPEFRHWQNYIAMNSVNGVFTYKYRNSVQRLTLDNAYERLKLRNYEKNAFIRRIKNRYFPGRMLEVIDVRRVAILASAMNQK